MSYKRQARGMTTTLSEERQCALKEAAARRGTTITALIDESLERAGIRSQESAQEIVSRPGMIPPRQ